MAFEIENTNIHKRTFAGANPILDREENFVVVYLRKCKCTLRRKRNKEQKTIKTTVTSGMLFV